MAFLPRSFTPPDRVSTDNFIVRPITVHDVVRDYDAVMSSYDHLHKMFGEAWGWPYKSMTLEQNLIDLGWHQKEYQLKSSFDYAVLDPDESRIVGCLYIDPPTKAGYDAEGYCWARASELKNGLDEALYQFLRAWIENSWPFKAVAYPGRDISWETWNNLPDIP